MRTYFIVANYRDNTRVSKGFSTYGEAEAEAEKLARENPGEYFTVFQAIGRVTSPTRPIVWSHAS